MIKTKIRQDDVTFDFENCMLSWAYFRNCPTQFQIKFDQPVATEIYKVSCRLITYLSLLSRYKILIEISIIHESIPVVND